MPRHVWVLVVLVLGLGGCVFKRPAQPPLRITAPPDGISAFVHQTVQVAVHHSWADIVITEGRLEVHGPVNGDIPLAFTRQVSGGPYVAEAEWTPTQPGDYRLQAVVRIQEGDTHKSEPITVHVIQPQPIRHSPLITFIGGHPITPTPVPMATSTPTATFTPTPTLGTPTPSVPCFMAKFVADVTIPDGTSLQPGVTFTKTWRLQNAGRCTWPPSTQVIFVSGDPMGAAPATTIGYPVWPNQTVDISIPMRAPDRPGHYRGEYKLRAPDGTVFGLGPQQNTFYVDIVVAATPTPTSPPPPQPEPDLVVKAIEFAPDPPVAGQPVEISVTVANYGQADANGFTVVWWPDVHQAEVCRWTNLFLPGNGGAASYHCRYTGYASPGTYSMGAMADSTGRIAESNEDNNTLDLTVNVVSGDTQGPTLKMGRSANQIYWPPPYCQPYEVTISGYAHDPSGVVWVRLKYRVVDTAKGRTGQWVTKDFTLAGTNYYTVTLTEADLKASLNPPLQGTQGKVEYFILAKDTVGNLTNQGQPDLTLLYCVY